MMIKKNYKKILLALFILVLFFVSFTQYEEKRMYEAYISVGVKNDIQRLVNAIIENQKLYGSILDEKIITRYDAYRLDLNHSNIRDIPQKYEGLAERFDRLELGTTQNITAGNAQKISVFFGEMIKGESIDSDNMGDVIFELNDDMKEKIIQLKELNSLWLGSVKNNVVGVTEKQGFNSQEFQNYYGDNSLSDSFWVNLVVDLDSDTKSYLHDHELLGIENVFYSTKRSREFNESLPPWILTAPLNGRLI